MPQFPNNFDFSGGGNNFTSQPLQQQQGQQGQPSGVGVDLTQNPDELFSHKNLEEQLHHHFYKGLLEQLNGGQRQTLPPAQFPDQGQQFNQVPGQFNTMPLGGPQQGQMHPIVQQLLQLLGGGGNQGQDQTSQWNVNHRNLPPNRLGTAGMPTSNSFLPMIMQQLGMGRPQMNAYNQGSTVGRM